MISKQLDIWGNYYCPGEYIFFRNNMGIPIYQYYVINKVRRPHGPLPWSVFLTRNVHDNLRNILSVEDGGHYGRRTLRINDD